MYVASKLKEQINDPVTQNDIENASMAACAALPEGMMRDACTSFVEQYGEHISGPCSSAFWPAGWVPTTGGVRVDLLFGCPLFARNMCSAA
jgi:hypothetical protein